ncbi:MAG: serine hydrolase [Blautia faecis]
MVIHKWKVWVVRIAFLCGLLIISSTLQTEAATKNSWTVKVNNEYKAKLVKKKDQWYLQSTSIQMKNKKGTERIAYLFVPSKAGLASGYYYFWADGRIDKRKKFHTLDTKIGTTRFKGSYYFGETAGRLKQTAGWIMFKGKKLALNKNGKLYTNRLYKGYYLTEDGTIATNRKISSTLYVDVEGKKCAKEEVKLSRLRTQINEKLKTYSGNWSVYVKDLKTGDVLSINETSMYPASVIKLFVMEAVYAGAAEKKISLNSYVNGLLDSMITISDNESYNELVRTVGQGSFA